MEILLIIGLTLLNGLFAMSELALASSRKARLAAMAEAGDKGAASALQLLGNPTQFLSTVQVGITSIGVLNGIVGEAAFSGNVSLWLQSLGLQSAVAGVAATALVVTIITFTTIIFGELVPKRIGQLYPETVARAVSPFMRGLARAAKPFVALLSLSTHGVLKLLRIDSNVLPTMTQEEISASLVEGVDAGLIEAHEHQMVQNVFRLDDRPLTSLMVPRQDIAWFDSSLTPTQCLQWVRSQDDENHHSWYPVCRGGLDQVAGVISLAQLLKLESQGLDTLANHLQAATFVPETLSAMDILEQMRTQAGRFSLVVDEYGEVQGLLTPRDILEAITGELRPEQESEAWSQRSTDGSWLLDGLMPIYELKTQLQLDDLPDESKGLYNTLAGLLLNEAGHLPEKNEIIECAGWGFEIMQLQGRRIDKVYARPLSNRPQ